MVYPAAGDKTFFDGPSHATETADYLGKRMGDAEFVEHLRTYRGFVKGMLLFAGHVLVILMLLAFFLM